MREVLSDFLMGLEPTGNQKEWVFYKLTQPTNRGTRLHKNWLPAVSPQLLVVFAFVVMTWQMLDEPILPTAS